MCENVVDIYIRLSDQDRDKRNENDESESIQNQRNLLVNYCRERGWSINKIYVDEDYSGADNTRPAWNKMLDDCRENRCNTVLCKTLSRFSRDMEMVEKYVHGKFVEWGIRFVSVVDNVDTALVQNKKSRQINGLINEWYLDDLSENIKATLSAKRKRGEFVGSFAPYGYIVDKQNKNHLVIDPFAAAVVRRIFSMYIEGFGYIAIAKKLNEDGISPPCERKHELGLKYRNANYENKPQKGWTDSSVYAILRRFEYTGAVVQGRQTVVNYKTKTRKRKRENQWDVVENMHEPIVSKEDFLLAQSIRKNRGKGTKIPSGECHPLANKIFCGECKNTMWKTSYISGKNRYSYFSCRTRKTSKNLCDNSHHIRSSEIEKIVLSEINRLIKNYFDENSVKFEGTEYLCNISEKVVSSRQKEVENELYKCENRLFCAYKDRADGIISAEIFKKLYENILREKEKFEAENKLLKSTKNIKTDVEKSSKTEIVKKYRIISKLSPEIAQEFVDKIYVFGVKSNSTRKILIKWKI